MISARRIFLKKGLLGLLSVSLLPPSISLLSRRSPNFSVGELFSQLSFKKEEPDEKKDLLTEKEQEIIQLLDKGLSQDKIAEKLFITPNTVKAHTKHIRAKYEVTTTKEAIRRYRLRKNG